MKLIISAIFFAIFCATFSFYYVVYKTFNNPYSVVCNLVANKIYLSDQPIKKWKQKCLHRANLVTPFSSKKLIIQDLNHMFEFLKVSHLEIYDPQEVKNIWMGESNDTGLEGDFVDGELVIFKVHSESPGGKAGIRKGDIVELINGEHPSSWAVAHQVGTYKIVRNQKNIKIEIKPGTFQRNDKPYVQDVFDGHKILTVPTFRSDFFSHKDIDEIYNSLRDAHSVILDLRGNSGGNFVAGLRLLSLFICQKQIIGYLKKPRAEENKITLIDDNLNDDYQVKILEESSEIVLQSPENKNCFSGLVRILVDGKTSSVAEMVALGLREILKSQIAGAPSRGQLLVGVWYPLNELSAGVEISIPEAYYQSFKGEQIEGRGLQVDKTLYYELIEMTNGVDSWVESLLKK